MSSKKRNYETFAAEQVCQAIRTHTLIKFRYEFDRLDREFAPYAIYESILGNIIVYGYQLRNTGKPLDCEQLRYYALRRLRAIRLTDISFDLLHNLSQQELRGCRQLILTVTSP